MMNFLSRNELLKFVAPTCVVILIGILTYKNIRKNQSADFLGSSAEDSAIESIFVSEEKQVGIPVEVDSQQEDSEQKENYTRINPVLLLQKLDHADKVNIFYILDALSIQCRDERIQTIVTRTGGLEKLCKMCATEENPSIVYRVLLVLAAFAIRQRYIYVFSSTKFMDSLFFCIEKYSTKEVTSDPQLFESDEFNALKFALLCVQNISFHSEGCSLFPTEKAVTILSNLKDLIQSGAGTDSILNSIDKCILHFRLAK